VTKINLNLTSEIMADIYRFMAFAEMRSYSEDLRKFRPLLRPIVPEIEKTRSVQGPRGAQKVNYDTPIAKKKRRLICRDWLQMSLWYIRLKKASTGQTPF
jgi:hypothetical protein